MVFSLFKKKSDPNSHLKNSGIKEDSDIGTPVSIHFKFINFRKDFPEVLMYKLTFLQDN